MVLWNEFLVKVKVKVNLVNQEMGEDWAEEQGPPPW
jgi:hypothetical protein